MKLVSFSVTNYRSITTAHKIEMGPLTVLVGKNNEGKSNVLSALNVAMTAVITHSKSDKLYHNGLRGLMNENLSTYTWKRDFPIPLQTRKRRYESEFRLNFRLNTKEKTDFHTQTGIRGNEDIPIIVTIGKDNKFKVSVPKKGSSVYNQKSKQVTDFISERISFNCIGAIRTEETTKDALQTILNNELYDLEKKPEYQEAMTKIRELQKERLDSIAEKIKIPLKEFLPNIDSVEIINSESIGRRLTRGYGGLSIMIDDGTRTDIEFKGDGVKSLVALAILKDKYYIKEASIIAIEEPEVHLHPAAIHQLVDVINSLARTNQVIITTHNPLFVSRNKLESNIIIDHNRAKTAKTINEIRNVLGILPSDNLIHANNLLIVEGENDKIALGALLPELSPTIKSALTNHSLEIMAIGGASHLQYHLTTLKNFLCRYMVFFDYDEEGKKAVQKAKSADLLRDDEVKYCSCHSKKEAELEDCFNPLIYCEDIKNQFGVELVAREFLDQKKWSKKMETAFQLAGVEWNPDVMRKVKSIVAQKVASNPLEALFPERRSTIDALAHSLEVFLSVK
ncbi:MAG: AAA family ATPase [Clostridia bacterium]|nr:AAA family ATPase [Clostridia bacterium]